MSDLSAQLDPQKHAWLRDPALGQILAAIKTGGGEARVVGGTVRDALLSREVHEIDLAVNLPPEKVSELLEKAHIKTVPTGLAHGTITAICDHKGFEITTLRKDVETDGRRAKVAFTDDWEADATRRDFTINAIYADANGILYDYVGGRQDLNQGRVRFIGDAEDRIQEDVLRILRFFRFTAWFARGDADAEGLMACRALASRIPKLSVERVWREIVKLLNAPNPLPTWKLMKETDVLGYILPEANNLKKLEALQKVERRYDISPSPLVRLAALLPEDGVAVNKIIQKLKLSNREAEKLRVVARLPEQLAGKLDPTPFRRALYEYGTENARDAALLLAAGIPSLNLEDALTTAAEWDKPVFPLQGEDILKWGVAPGPKIGDILRSVETWWIERDFRPDRAQCIAEAKRKIA